MTDKELDELRSMIMCSIGIYNRYRVCLDRARREETEMTLRQIYDALSLVTEKNNNNTEREVNRNEIS